MLSAETDVIMQAHTFLENTSTQHKKTMYGAL